MAVPDWSAYDEVEFGGGRREWVRPTINNGAFYNFGEEVELDLPDGYTSEDGFAVPYVRKDSNGTVYVRGIIKAPVASFEGVVVVLPEGYRPSEVNEVVVSVGFITATESAGSGNFPLTLIVGTDGVVSPGLPNFIGGDTLNDFIDGLTDPVLAFNVYGSFPTKNANQLHGVLPAIGSGE